MKSILKNISFLIAIVSIMSFSAQDFYSSMTKVDFVEGSGTLKFTTKLNTSHISDAIKINPNTAGFEAEVKRYIHSNFHVTVNGTAKNITFTGSQVNGETVWVYFETSGISTIQSLKIRNSILLTNYPKQLNLVNVAYKGQQRTLNFVRGSDTQEIKF